MPVKGMHALITGGCQGLGKAFAIALLNKGASKVCLLDINPNGGSTAKELSSLYKSAQVDFLKVDVTQFDQLKDSFEFAKKNYGHLDLVCNNAGIISQDSDVKRSILQCRLNFEAVYYGIYLGTKYMSREAGHGGKGGMIINVASMAAFVALPSSYVYSGTKAGVFNMTLAAGAQSRYEATGVQVNCICPTFTETKILTSGVREYCEAAGHRILTPEFVAEAFIQLVESGKTAAVMRVTPQRGIDYFKSRNPTVDMLSNL